jgi:hypothetical protein
MTTPSEISEEPVRLLDMGGGLSGALGKGTDGQASPDTLAMLEAARDCDPSDEEVASLSSKLAPLMAPVAASVVTGIALTEAAKGGTSIAAWLKSLLISKWIVTGTVVAGTTVTAVAVTQLDPEPEATVIQEPALAISAGPRHASTTPAVAIAEPDAPDAPDAPLEIDAVAGAAHPVAVLAAPSETNTPEPRGATPSRTAPQARATSSDPAGSALLSPEPTRAPSSAPPTAAFPSVAAPPPAEMDEGELLSQAFAALQAGDGAVALALTREHRALTGTALSQERERIAIEALVQLGQRSTAKARAEAFARRFPNSTYLLRINALFRSDSEKEHGE